MEDTLFLVCFFGTPVLMVLALALLGLRAIKRKRALAGQAGGSGWVDGSDEAVHVVMDPILTGRKVTVSHTLQKGELTLSQVHWRSRKNMAGQGLGGTRTVLIVPLPDLTPSVTVQCKVGGLLESAALGAVGGSLRQGLGQAWEWAMVDASDAPAEWFTDERGRALEQTLARGERVHLRDGFGVLSLEGPPTSDRLEVAEAQANELRLALA